MSRKHIELFQWIIASLCGKGIPSNILPSTYWPWPTSCRVTVSRFSIPTNHYFDCLGWTSGQRVLPSGLTQISQDILEGIMYIDGTCLKFVKTWNVMETRTKMYFSWFCKFAVPPKF